MVLTALRAPVDFREPITGDEHQGAGMVLRRSIVPFFIALFALTGVASAEPGYVDSAREISGAGSTFVTPILTKWADDYAKVSGVKVAYQSVGSGAGIEKIRSGEVDFGASDKPLSAEELEMAGLCQFPIVVGGVVPVVNLPGVAPGQIKFSGKLLGDIYLGKVTSWDALEIKALNPSLDLPKLPITVVHRSDGSGTTYNWVDFLSKENATWKEKVGRGLTVGWPVGVGGNGNPGVSEAVMQTPGSIGYVEYAFALENKLAFGQVENNWQLFVSPSIESFQEAAKTADWKNYKDFSVLLTDLGGPGAYPITATTFIVMFKKPKDPARSAAALAFFKWAFENGEQQAAGLHYVSLPWNVVRLVKRYWASQIESPPRAATN